MNDEESHRPAKQPRFRLQFSLKALLVLTVVTALLVAHYSNRPIELDSSSINTVQYNHWNGTLVIRFQSGDSYRYFDIPRETYRGLMQSDSHGKYFYKEIRNSNFKFEKLKN